VREYPRRAGVSAFGAGGSNAHILVEEYLPGDSKAAYREDRQPIAHLNRPVLIVLSARNESRLKQKAQQLIARLNVLSHPSGKLSDPPEKLLADLAYTLQVGRDAMKERLAMEVSSLRELKDNLAAFVAGETPAGVYRGQVYDNIETLNDDGEDENEFVERCVARREYSKLLETWTKGKVIKWDALYLHEDAAANHPGRISLPAYPFARERYWIPRQEPAAPAQPAQTAAPAQPVQPAQTAPPVQPVKVAAPPDDPTIRRLEHKLKLLLAGIVKYDIGQIDLKEPFAGYGIDSIMIHMINKQLAEIYGELPSHLLFDCYTLELLADHLVNNYRDGSMRWIKIEAGL
jgi:polyketide synthase PksN